MPQLGQGSNTGTGNDSSQAVPQALLTALWPCCSLPPGLINPYRNPLRGTGLRLCYRLGNKLREVNRLPKVTEHTDSRAKTQTEACWQLTPATPPGAGRSPTLKLAYLLLSLPRVAQAHQVPKPHLRCQTQSF